MLKDGRQATVNEFICTDFLEDFIREVDVKYGTTFCADYYCNDHCDSTPNNVPNSSYFNWRLCGNTLQFENDECIFQFSEELVDGEIVLMPSYMERGNDMWSFDEPYKAYVRKPNYLQWLNTSNRLKAGYYSHDDESIDINNIPFIFCSTHDCKYKFAIVKHDDSTVLRVRIPDKLHYGSSKLEQFKVTDEVEALDILREFNDLYTCGIYVDTYDEHVKDGLMFLSGKFGLGFVCKKYVDCYNDNMWRIFTSDFAKISYVGKNVEFCYTKEAVTEILTSTPGSRCDYVIHEVAFVYENEAIETVDYDYAYVVYLD